MVGLLFRRQEAAMEPLSRDQLLRYGRIAVLDDDTPEVLADLKHDGFSVDHFMRADEIGRNLDQERYDVLLLDYGGVGTRYGPDEGLDVLRHVKRVNPALRVIAYLGRTFDASKADFFRLCDRVVKKDAGIRELTETIEAELTEALSPSRLWEMICKEIGLPPGSREAKRIRQAIIDSKKEESLSSSVRRALQSEIALHLAEKLLSVIVRAAIA